MRNSINYNSINYKLGQNIAKLRLDSGYSQQSFANECGISRAYYGRCELGIHSFTVDKLKLIANLLNIGISDLFIDNKGNKL